MPNTPILQEIHADLSLWQKIKLLAKIYWRYFIESVPVKTLVFFFGVPIVMIFNHKQVKVTAGEIMAEELGKKLPKLSDADWFIDKTYTSQGRYVSGSQFTWEQEICNRLGDYNLLDYCTIDELDRWYEYDKYIGFRNLDTIFRAIKNRGKCRANKPQLTQPSYYSGSVPSGNYYVDLRWDTVANGEVNYKDFWR